MPHILLVAPAGRTVGLTSVCLGIVRALDRQGVRVAFAKPISARGQEHSVALMRLGANLHPPAPISRNVAEELLAAGDDQTLMEHVVALCTGAAERADVLVVEGMVPEVGMVWATRVNALMLRALDAELILVSAPRGQTPAEVADGLAIAARGYGPHAEGRSIDAILNRVCNGQPGHFIGDAEQLAPTSGECSECRVKGLGDQEIEAYRAALAGEKIRCVAVVPCSKDIAAPRVRDVAAAVGARVISAGAQATRRVRDVALCAMTVPNAIRAFKPGTLLITPGDRNDILLAASLATQAGTPLAGVLLTGGIAPDSDVLGLCQPALDAGLPVLAVEDGSYRAAARVSAMDQQIPADDSERVERTMTYVADRIDAGWLKGLS
ncbi:MAG: DRTGG domain-containing protein, partial [Anaeromyxobacteraceae bacterium]